MRHEYLLSVPCSRIIYSSLSACLGRNGWSLFSPSRSCQGHKAKLPETGRENLSCLHWSLHSWMNYPRGQALSGDTLFPDRTINIQLAAQRSWAACSRGNYLQLAQLLQIGEDQLPGMLAFEGNWTEVNGWGRRIRWVPVAKPGSFQKRLKHPTSRPGYQGHLAVSVKNHCCFPDYIRCGISRGTNGYCWWRYQPCQREPELHPVLFEWCKTCALYDKLSATTQKRPPFSLSPHFFNVNHFSITKGRPSLYF